MNNRITVRTDEALQEEIDNLIIKMCKDGFDMDQSKIIRYLLKKGLESVAA